jgi:hypothetical protein
MIAAPRSLLWLPHQDKAGTSTIQGYRPALAPILLLMR